MIFAWNLRFNSAIKPPFKVKAREIKSARLTLPITMYGQRAILTADSTMYMIIPAAAKRQRMSIMSRGIRLWRWRSKSVKNSTAATTRPENVTIGITIAPQGESGVRRVSIRMSIIIEYVMNLMNWLVLLYSIRSIATAKFHIIYKPKSETTDHAGPPTAILTIGQANAERMKGRRRILISFSLVALFLLSSG